MYGYPLELNKTAQLTHKLNFWNSNSLICWHITIPHWLVVSEPGFWRFLFLVNIAVHRKVTGHRFISDPIDWRRLTSSSPIISPAGAYFLSLCDWLSYIKEQSPLPNFDVLLPQRILSHTKCLKNSKISLWPPGKNVVNFFWFFLTMSSEKYVMDSFLQMIWWISHAKLVKRRGMWAYLTPVGSNTMGPIQNMGTCAKDDRIIYPNQWISEVMAVEHLAQWQGTG